MTIIYSKYLICSKRLISEIEAVTTSKIYHISHDKLASTLKISYTVEPSEIEEIETVVENHSHETLDEVRDTQKTKIKKSYLNNIVVDIETDNVFIWYDKLKSLEINTEDDDTKYNENMAIWENAWTEYKTKKAQIYSETDFEVIKNIQYEDQCEQE